MLAAQGWRETAIVAKRTRDPSTPSFDPDPLTGSLGPVPVMLVDDHPLWRQTLRQVLEHKRIATVVAEASDGPEALELAASTKPALVVMDIDLPAMDGVETTRRLLADQHVLKVLVLSAFDERSRVVEAVRAGASGYLLKTASSEEIVDAVTRIQHGELVFPPALADVVLAEMRRGSEQEVSGLSVVLAAESALRRAGLEGILKELGCKVSTVADLTELGAAAGEADAIVVAVGSRSDATIQTIEDMRATLPGIPLVLLADEVEPSDATTLVSAGSGGFGYLLSDRIKDLDELRDALHRVAQGESVIDPDVVRSLVGRASDPLEELTAGERDVLALMAEGRSNQAISERLFLSPKTVEARVGSIFSKLRLEPAADDHRRVLAVVTYLKTT